MSIFTVFFFSFSSPDDLFLPRCVVSGVGSRGLPASGVPPACWGGCPWAVTVPLMVSDSLSVSLVTD